MTIAADRDLLFGLLALQNGLIDQGQLVAAFQAWTRDKSGAMADLLEARGDLTPPSGRCSEALADGAPRSHGGDAEKSLAAVAAGSRPARAWPRIGDPDIEATLGPWPRRRLDSTDGDPDRTATYAVGTATSDGQRFRVLRPHARGGLGAVFVALDGELNREVALKQILDHHADDPTSRARFLLEAEITGGLEHPGIVPVYGLGTTATAGRTTPCGSSGATASRRPSPRFHADERLKKDPGRRSLALRKLLRRFVDVCNAIDYAHSRGVLHRDLKPGNMIVGKHGETLVVDWGLAKPMGRPRPARRPASGRSMPVVGQRLGRDAARLGDGHAGLHEPRAGRAATSTGSARAPTSTAWAPRSTAC